MFTVTGHCLALSFVSGHSRLPHQCTLYAKSVRASLTARGRMRWPASWFCSLVFISHLVSRWPTGVMIAIVMSFNWPSVMLSMKQVQCSYVATATWKFSPKWPETCSVWGLCCKWRTTHLTIPVVLSCYLYSLLHLTLEINCIRGFYKRFLFMFCPLWCVLLPHPGKRDPDLSG